MKKLRVFIYTITSILVLACAKERGRNRAYNDFGEIRISLEQDRATTEAPVKAGAVQENLPSADDFNIEIFNSKAQRIYRKKYIEAKTETIKLNTGDFNLKAFHGDSTGCGFDKPFFMANQPFTVHGYIDNGKIPDKVEAVAKLANVKIAVKYGPGISGSYSDFYTLVKHKRLIDKSLKFSRKEARCGYIPSGELYIEVYAQLGGAGMKDSLVYFKSEPALYSPNDFVTFNIEAPTRTGGLDVNITVDNSVEKIEERTTIPPSALPGDAPSFSYNGLISDSFSYKFNAGAITVNDAVLSYSAPKGVTTATLSVNSDFLNGTLGLPSEIDPINADEAMIAKFQDAGIKWIVKTDSRLGFIDFSGAVRLLGSNAPLSTTATVRAVFSIEIKDKTGKTGHATYNLVQRPASSTISVSDHNIWGWKFSMPEAVFKGSGDFPADTDVKIQCSEDGLSWKTVAARKIEGNHVYFNDIEGLKPGTDYKLRTVFNNDPDNVGETAIIRTEAPEQIGNGGFEEFVEKTFITKISWGFGKTFTVKWWQLYNSDNRWWAVNSPVTLNSKVTAGLPDYKTYPTVALFTDGAYSGHSLMVASIAIDDVASEIFYGKTHQGEIFIGTANDLNEDSWAKTSEGHSFGSRPSALSFMHRFDVSDDTPFDVSIEILSAEGNIIGAGSKSDQHTPVSEWTECRIPLTYTITDKKAATIKLSIKSSVTGSEAPIKRSVDTISGNHIIHAGNILYIDNIELKYE